MAKVNHLNALTFCPRIVSSFEEGYNGSLPPDYLPIEFTNLENVMAMFWRVKSWRIEVTRQSIATPALPFETYSFVAENQNPDIVTEINLVCQSSLRWRFLGTKVFPGGTVAIDATIDFDQNLFLLDRTYYLPLAIDIIIGEHSYTSGPLLNDGTVFRTEYLGAGALFPSDATFSLLGMASNLLCTVEDSPVVVASATCSIHPEEFWPYANEDGSAPAYNTSTGAPI